MIHNDFDIRDIDVRYSPTRYIFPHATDKDKITIQPPGHRNLYLQFPGGDVLRIKEAVHVASSALDTGTLENGKDYNTYACYDDGNLVFLNSKALTYPAGYSADEVLNIGGYHTLCGNIGTIASHPLSGYVAGQILPTGVWDLKHRAKNLDNRGLVYDDLLHLWIQIYLASDNGANGVQSVYGATILDTIDWNAFVERAGKVGMRLLTDPEFQIAARGTNEETNITGSADPVTTGGHVDTASRRMVTHTGLEDMTGVMNQWLQDQSYRFDMSPANMTVTAAATTCTVYHAASPGGNQIYLKFDAAGMAYLCCNMATATADKWISFGSNQKMVVKHDANANTGLPVYMNRAGTEPGKILINNTIHEKNVYIPTNYFCSTMLQLVHDASAATNGVPLYYDDGADNRLEATFSNSANNTFDACYFSPSWAYYNLQGTVGSVYRQGDYGDVKLLAGGNWNRAAIAGSQSRLASNYRWLAYTSIGGRFAVPSL